MGAQPPAQRRSLAIDARADGPARSASLPAVWAVAHGLQTGEGTLSAMDAPVVIIRQPGRTPLHLIVRDVTVVGRDCEGVLLTDPQRRDGICSSSRRRTI